MWNTPWNNYNLNFLFPTNSKMKYFEDAENELKKTLILCSILFLPGIFKFCNP
jgi:hypothetical protein